MIGLQNCELVSVCPPAAIKDNAAYTTTEIDTLGFDYLQIVVYLGATDIAMTELLVTESDTSGSGHANVTGLVFGTSTNTAGSTSTLPSATDDNKFFVFDIDLRGRKRYLDCSATAGDGTAGTYAAIWAVLSRAEDTPTTAAQRGASQILRAFYDRILAGPGAGRPGGEKGPTARSLRVSGCGVFPARPSRDCR